MAKHFNFERSVSPDNPVRADEARSAERTLARLVAAAFAADHPELFRHEGHEGHIMSSRPETPTPSLSGASDQGIPAAGETHARIE